MKAWTALSANQQRAGVAAAALFLTLFLPWYHQVPIGQGDPHNLTAFGVFSFVEAAVLVVAVAILYLLYARSQRRGFHLPGGDGWAVTIGGGWVVFLLIWRLFDKPEVKSGTVGVQWGIFVAMAVGAVLVAAGQGLRAAHQPEPPNPAEDLDWTDEAARTRRRGADRRDRRPVDATAVTRALREERPAWRGEPPEPPDPSGAPTRRLGDDAPDSAAAPTRQLGQDAPPAADEDASQWRTRPLWEDGSPPPRHRQEGDDGDDERLFDV